MSMLIWKANQDRAHNLDIVSLLIFTGSLSLNNYNNSQAKLIYSAHDG